MQSDPSFYPKFNADQEIYNFFEWLKVNKSYNTKTIFTELC